MVEAVEKKWVFGWEKKNFKGKKNPDLWLRFRELYEKHQIKFKWIKGHNDHIENEEMRRACPRSCNRKSFIN